MCANSELHPVALSDLDLIDFYFGAHAHLNITHIALRERALIVNVVLEKSPRSGPTPTEVIR